MLNTTSAGGASQHHQQNSSPFMSRPTSLLLPPNTTASTGGSSGYTPSSFSTLLIPTGGTPLAMTPNTLKSFEQSILQTLGEDPEQSYIMESQQYSGNFVPPLPSNTSTITLINTWQGGQVSSTEDSEVKKDEDEEEKVIEEQPVKKKLQPKRKNTRQPQPQKAKPQAAAQPKEKKQKSQANGQKSGLTEEDERRKIRRERNKQAAARCRKRRVDHTNKLIEETEGLEAKKRSLQTQITELQSQKEELEFILEAHNCVKKIKSEVQVLTDLQNLPSKHENKLKRPNTLNVLSSERGAGNVSSPPIPINTPSNGIANLGFEPLCSDWGINTPTPVGDACEEKVVPDHRIISSESNNKCSLVTPVNPYKKLENL